MDFKAITSGFLLFRSSDNNMEHLVSTWIILMLTAVIVCFIISELTRNYSQVDKLWSIMPIIYSLITLISHPSPRLLLMSVMVIIWGIRLSYNFYRKGGYNLLPWKGEEDYRWKNLRSKKALKGRIRFGLFNLLFISFYQHFLILLFSSPLLVAADYQQTDLRFLDLAAAILMAGFILIETIADNQQYRFQMLRRQKAVNSEYYCESLKNGFLSEGMWQYVRHPNFAAEQAVWISFYLFGVSASGMWLNWTLTGPVLLVLLFQGSTRFTENISRAKYKEYDSYKRTVPAFIPRPFKKVL